MNERKRLGAQLRDARVESDLTPDQAASAAGISQEELLRLENGETELMLTQATKLGHLYSASLDDWAQDLDCALNRPGPESASSAKRRPRTAFALLALLLPVATFVGGMNFEWDGRHTHRLPFDVLIEQIEANNNRTPLAELNRKLRQGLDALSAVSLRDNPLGIQARIMWNQRMTQLCDVINEGAASPDVTVASEFERLRRQIEAMIKD